MFVSGVVCDLTVGLMANYIPLVWIVGAFIFRRIKIRISRLLDVLHPGAGTVATTIACLLFATIVPTTTYWAYAFVGISLSIMGPDLIFTAGTLFIAKFSLPHEQSVAGGLFNTVFQVC
jgi:hypothetical protein